VADGRVAYGYLLGAGLLIQFMSDSSNSAIMPTRGKDGNWEVEVVEGFMGA